MADRVYSVAQINAYIRNMFTQDYVLNHVLVKGEVSNCKYHTSGHLYFTLKDQDMGLQYNTGNKSGSWSAIACIMFAGNRSKLPFKLEDGQSVILEGSVNVYDRDGKYQIYVNNITLDGIGKLHLLFEKTKEELAEMGMFDPMYKKPIPAYCSKIGVVTASTGAAIQDIINVSQRRNPHIQIYLYPALVQGQGAASSIAKGIQTLDRMGVDCIIVGRGGGSIEDLWAFNEIEVAEAIFQAQTPIISAVGHQTDYTIADFVSDLRAPTPSAAAELATVDYIDLMNRFLNYEHKLDTKIRFELEKYRMILNKLELSLQNKQPQNELKQKKQQLLFYKEQLYRMMSDQLTVSKNKLETDSINISGKFSDYFKELKQQLTLKAQKLDDLSPLKRLSNGYSFTVKTDGTPLQSISQISKGEHIQFYLGDGKAEASIVKVWEDKTV